MKYYKIGNAPYKFPVSKEDYFARYEMNEQGEQVRIEADTHSYVEITEKEYNKLEKELNEKGEL